MNINKVKINGFGNLQNREIEFKKGLNLICGDNENGKSTLLKFITSMFFGLSKSKIGKEISDVDKYTPWNSNAFSGKIDYELDNGEKYQVFRDFNTKEVQIFDEKYEEISNKYPVDKTCGKMFFKEQTGLDENLLCSTMITEQGKSKLNKNEQSSLVQKITNLISTGEDNVSYKMAMDKLNKKLIEQVGTDRTSGRPINILNEKISNIDKQKRELEEDLNDRVYMEKEKTELERNQLEEKSKLEFIKQVRKNIESNRISKEKIQVNYAMEDNYKEQYVKLEDNIKKNQIEKSEIHVGKGKYILFLIIGLLGIGSLKYFTDLIENQMAIIAGSCYSGLVLVILVYNLIKSSKKKKTIDQKNEMLKFQKAEFENNIKNIEDTINKIETEIKIEKEMQEQKLQMEFRDKIPQLEMQTILYSSYQDLLTRIEEQEKVLGNINLKVQTLAIREERIRQTEEQYKKLQIELKKCQEEKEKLYDLQDALELTKEVLEIAYQKAKENITPKFRENLSKCASRISDGLYNNVIFTEEKGLYMELNDGKMVSVESLSTGTIEQMYLALRMNILSEVVKEKVPIILDEPFVYYDNNRLKNILKYLDREYSDRQILIFSCSNREYQALKEMEIPFNCINVTINS